MTINLTVRSGTARAYPQDGDEDWGVDASALMVDVVAGVNASATTNNTMQYDAIVGSAAQVTAGTATHTTFAAMLAAVSNGDIVFVREGSWEQDATFDITKSITIVGSGEGSVLTTSAAFAAGAIVTISADGVTLHNVKIDDGTGAPDYAISISAGVVRCNASVKIDGTYAIAPVLNDSDCVSDTTADGAVVGPSGDVQRQVKDNDATAYQIGSSVDPDMLVFDTTTGAKTLKFNCALGGSNVLDEDNMASDSATSLATQQSIKAYVDTKTAAQNEFTELTDTPASYVGQAEKLVKVNAGENALEFYDQSSIDHDALTNTHNLTTDIDHDAITNTHNLTTDIDHDALTNTHNLTTDIDHDALTNTHNLTTDIDHDALTNTHQGVDTADAPTFDGVTLTDAIVFDELAATPANPGAGDKKFYAKNDGKLYTLDSAGNEIEVGSGGGGGGINYIEDSDAEAGTGSWATYADAAGTTPVDGDGAGATVTWTQNTTTPLRGTADFKLAKDAADRQGEGVSYDFSIDRADVNKQLWISFDVDATDTDYAAGDLVVYVYDIDNTALITPSYTSIAGALYEFKCSFNATDSVNYRLIIHVSSTNAAAYDIYFDNFKIGPEELIQTTPVSDWTSYTATLNSDTAVTKVTKYRRIGDTIKIIGTLTWSGAGNNSDLTVALPSGLTIDSTKIGSTTAYECTLGTAFWNDGGTLKGCSVIYEGSSTVSFVLEGGGTKIESDDFANGDDFSFIFEAPVAEWSSSSVGLSNSRVEYAAAAGTWDADDTTTVYGPRGQAITGGLATTRTKDITWLTPVQPTDHIFVEVDLGSGFGPVPNAAMDAYMRQNTLYYGVSCYQTGTYTTRVNFGRDAKATGSTFGSGGSTYSSGWRWRCVKSSNPLSIGMPTLYRWQLKGLSTDISADTNPITDLTFTLEAGKTYRISGQFYLRSSDGTYGYVDALDGANIVNRTLFDAGTQADDDGEAILAINTVYTMTGTALTFQFEEQTTAVLAGGGAGVYTDRRYTYIVVEELPYHIETSEW